MKSLIFIYNIFKKFPILFTSSILLLSVANLLDAASIFSLVVVVDLFVNPNLSGASLISKHIVAFVRSIGIPATLGWVISIFLIFNVLKIGFQILAQYSILRTKYSVLRNIMLETFNDFFSARWHFFSSAKQGTLVNTFIREISMVGDAISVMARYFSGILQIMLYMVVPIYLCWQVTLVTLGAALFFALPFFLLGRFSYRLGKLNTSTANQMGSVIQESLNLAKLILGFAKQHRSAEDLRTSFDRHRYATLRSQLLNFSMPLLYFPFGLLVLVIGLFMARRLTLPLSETAVLFYALARLIPAISNLTGDKSLLDNLLPSYEQIMQLRHSAKVQKQPTGSKSFSGFNEEILLENVSFAYPGQEPVLLDITMRIRKGTMVAIVGGSGAGKSTLIDTVMGFHEPTAGRVIFDGIPLSEFDINSYRRHVGYVPQDSVLFNMSIKDNLRWANESVNEAEITRACQQANAEEFIRQLPNGYNTIVGDRGVRLSGGQIQRIALARAILRQPELLILDEATSALDTYSERLIQQAIESIAKETTVIVIAHRLSTIMNAGYIYVIKDARVVEEGRYTQLMQRNGYFSNMAQLQAIYK